MKDIQAAVADILIAFDDTKYPLDFLEKYDQLEYLSEGHGTETFLVKKKCNDQLYITKCYDKKLYSFVGESNILKSMHHIGLPAFADEFQNDAMVCVVREYIVGTPLDQYAQENILTKKDAVDICIQLCDILTYLHGQDNPIIHRDIKPQNIIMKPNKTISLIDFDISRVYHSDAKNDTQFFGTCEYAPPEQYGFSQTDGRTDIYSTGVLLGWLLTGRTDTKEVLRKLNHDRLASIYKKCTSFSPENRFSSARKLKASLLHFENKHQRTVLKWSSTILACILFLYAGFFIGRYTDFASVILGPQISISFEEPMIEQAVRLQLGKAADEIITEEDLLSVTNLYIFGDSLITKTEEELYRESYLLFQKNQMEKGPIHSLIDLTKMPNLNQVNLSMQSISDISPLASLTNLELVDIKNNPVADISSLGELKFLKRVSLFDTRVTDLSPLAKCSMLHTIDAGKLPIHSLTAFAECRNLQNLILNETTLDTLVGVEALTQLTSLEVTSIIDDNLKPLLSLPHLEKLVLGEEMKQASEEIMDKAKFTITYR